MHRIYAYGELIKEPELRHSNQHLCNVCHVPLKHTQQQSESLQKVGSNVDQLLDWYILKRLKTSECDLLCTHLCQYQRQ